jgi:hypothetical protein
MSGTAGSKTWSEPEFKKLTGTRYRCFSYAYCGRPSPLYQRRHKNAMEWCLEHGVDIMMDSGAHSFHTLVSRGQSVTFNIKGKQIDLRQFMQDYADFVKQYSDKKSKSQFHWYVTLDYKRECPVIWEATKMLRDFGIRPVPVYHGDSSLDWLRRYIDAGHKLIGVGIHRQGTKRGRDGVRSYYDSIFDLTERQKVACHGFAVTGDYMFQYPWYSVDSTTWLKAAAFGKIIQIVPDRHRVALVHVSNRFAASTGYGTLDQFQGNVAKSVQFEIESFGFDFERVRNDLSYRASYNAFVFNKAIESRQFQGVWQPWQKIL